MTNTDQDFTVNRLAISGHVRMQLPGMTPRTDAELIALANAHALRELSEDDPQPWVCPVTISSDQVDSHWTFMDLETTLPNFATEAGNDRGVSVLDSHNNGRQPFGRSITGEVVEHEGVNYVASYFFTVPGIQTSTGMSTDDYIRNIERGISKEISVGLNFREDGKVECSICGLNMMSWDCPHWPGRRYMHPVDPDDPEGPQMESIAMGRILNGHLSEYSFVYKGSNRESTTLRLPEAKARLHVANGVVDLKQAFNLEREYGVDLHPWMPSRIYAPGGTIAYNGDPKDLAKEPTVAVTTKTKTTEPTSVAPVSLTWEALPDLRGMLEPFFTDTDDGLPDDPAEAIRAVAERADETVDRIESLESDLDKANAEIARLTPLAADGESYRADLIDDAIRQGIAAMDPDSDTPFPESEVREMLGGSSIKSIRAYRDSQRRIADRIVSPGRMSRDTVDPYRTSPKKEDGKLPAEAFHSGRR